MRYQGNEKPVFQNRFRFIQNCGCRGPAEVSLLSLIFLPPERPLLAGNSVTYCSDTNISYMIYLSRQEKLRNLTYKTFNFVSVIIRVAVKSVLPTSLGGNLQFALPKSSSCVMIDSTEDFVPGAESSSTTVVTT